MDTKISIKEEIYKLSAITDRGQRLNKLIAPTYKEKVREMKVLIEKLNNFSIPVSEENLSGNWELIFSDVELFRSSPFFLSIENALDDKKKSDLFFKLHQLQVGSFGISTIGRIGQHIDFKKKLFISTFDTTIFGLTTIPILGWFKLLPTFGGRVVTLANNLNLKDNTLEMTLEKTKVTQVEGLNRIPLFSESLMDRWFQVREIWNKLPWNKKEPYCKLTIIFIDEDLRIMRDIYGAIFIYIRESNSFLEIHEDN